MKEQKILSLAGQLTAIEGQSLDNLGAGIRGEIVAPDDPEYDSVREIWNAMIDRRPGLIVRCVEAGDVVKVVRFARHHRLRVSVRGGGHNIAGKSLQDGALLIDLSLMRTVQVDAVTREAVVGPGAALGDVDRATQAHCLVVPTGINSTTGIAGLTLGGGFGWLSRSLGMTVDNLIAADVVTAEGEAIRCDELNHASLFWALRGGGGNFGIVTAFEFKLHPLGPDVACGPIVFPFDQAGAVLRRYREFCAKCPNELTVWAVMRDAPPLPFLPADVHGTRVLILAGVYNGSLDTGRRALASLRKLGDPIADGFGVCPFVGFQQAFDPLLTPGARNYWKSHNFTALSDGLLDTLVDYGSRLPSPQSEIFVAQMGGVTNHVSSIATAYPHRDVEFIMNVHTRWDSADQDDGCTGWAREFYDATKPFATGGVYVNFISEGEDRVQGAYGGNYARLAAVKAKYDPDNFFSVNQNVRPS